MTTPGDSQKKSLILVDGSGYIFRAFHALPPLNRSDGLPTNAVRGFMSMLIKLLDGHSSDYIAVIFDASSKTFRNELYDKYKANRSATPEELIPQFPLCRDAARAMNLASVEQVGFEADDLIATYAEQGKARGLDVKIVSSDKDLMQLVGNGVTMLDPMKNVVIDVEQVVEKFGVEPGRVIDIQSLAGDSVDNVPGVPGIGIKTAAQLIHEYGDLDSLLARAGEIKQPKRRENLLAHADDARISRDLVTLRTDVPDLPDIDSLVVTKPDSEALGAFLNDMEFRSIATRMGVDLDGTDVNEAATSDEPAIDRDAYVCVTDEAALVQWIDEARAARAFAFDVETDNLDATQANLVGFSLATAPGRACYVPLAHIDPQAGDGGLDLMGATSIVQVPLDRALTLIKPLLEDPGVLKIGQNIKYDALVLRSYGLNLTPVDDTMVLSYVQSAGLHNHGLDELANRHLGHTNMKFNEVAGTGKSQVTFDRVPLDIATKYAAEDADVTLRLWRRLKPGLEQSQMNRLYQTIERPLISVLTDIESTGITVDVERLKTLSNELAQASATYEAEIYELAGERFTIGSPKQLGEILFGKMGLKGGKTGKSGAYSTDASVLEGLAAQGHELPVKVQAWRQVNKLKSTYTDALQAQVNPRTGRVHTSFGMAIASTGRLSSTDPNLQNIPIRTEEGRKIRGAFIPAEGKTLLAVDYSQIELRITAHVANEPALRQAFLDGLDIHALTASQVFDVPIEGMDPMVRRQAKAINFGIIYGISAFGLSNGLGISQGEAKEFIAAYFDRFPGIKTYMDSARAFGKEHGYVETLFGRRIHLPGIKAKIPAQRSFGERQAINAPIQGAAADIIKRAMIRIQPALDRAGLAAKMLLQVHDELLFEVDPAELEETTALVREVMEGAAAPMVNLSVPLVADAGFGANWGEAH